jgi:hypothetical protein
MYGVKDARHIGLMIWGANFYFSTAVSNKIRGERALLDISRNFLGIEEFGEWVARRYGGVSPWWEAIHKHAAGADSIKLFFDLLEEFHASKNR